MWYKYSGTADLTLWCKGAGTEGVLGLARLAGDDPQLETEFLSKANKVSAPVVGIQLGNSTAGRVAITTDAQNGSVCKYKKVHRTSRDGLSNARRVAKLPAKYCK